MSYDIHGETLVPGHCEVHPWINVTYPCHVCLQEQAKQKYKQPQPQYEIKMISVREHPSSTELNSELFEVVGENYPFRVRAVDKTTGEVGPQIQKFKKLSSAAKFHEDHGVTW